MRMLGYSIPVKMLRRVRKLMNIIDELGIDLVDLKVNEYAYATFKIKEIANYIIKLGKKVGLRIQFEDLNLACPLEELSTLTIRVVEDIVYKMADTINYVALNVGKLYQDVPHIGRRNMFRRFRRRLQSLLESIRKLEVTILIENPPYLEGRCLYDSLDNLKTLLSELNLKLAFNAGHFNTYMDPVASLKELKEYIGLIYLSDNEYGLDLHMPLGHGSLPLYDVIKCLVKYKLDTPIILDIYDVEVLRENIKILNVILEEVLSEH